MNDMNDWAGYHENMQDLGISDNALESEYIDNERGAGGTNMRTEIDTKSKVKTRIGNGNGMNLENLKKSAITNKRTVATNDKQGCKGIGRKHAGVNETRLKNSIKTISVSTEVANVENLEINEMTINYKQVVETGKYNPQPHPASRKSEDIWHKYQSNPLKPGTIDVVNCDEEYLTKFVQDIESKKIINSSRFELGVMYNTPIQNRSFQLTYDVIKDDNSIISYPIIAIDPLGMDIISPENKKTLQILVQYNKKTNETVQLFYEPAITGESKCLGIFSKGLSNRTQIKIINKKDLKGFEEIKSWKLEATYSDKWNIILKKIFDYIGQPNIILKKIKDKSECQETKCQETKCQETNKFMSGIYYQRIDKVINHTPGKKASSGNKNRYIFVENSRFRITFNVNMDKEFGVLVNKGKLEEDKFDNLTAQMIKCLESKFITEQYNLHTGSTGSEDVDEYDSDDSYITTISVSSKTSVLSNVKSKGAVGEKVVKAGGGGAVGEKVVKSGGGGAVGEKVVKVGGSDAVGGKVITVGGSDAVGEKDIKVGGSDAVDEKIVKVGGGESEQIKKSEKGIKSTTDTICGINKIEIVPIIPVVNNKTIVQGYSRTTSKSDKEILQKMMELQEVLKDINLQEKIDISSENTKSGNTEIFKSIIEILNFIKK